MPGPEDNNLSAVNTVETNKAGLITDLNPSFVSKEQYTHARNATRNSKDGDLGTVGNEPSNLLCFNTPYKILGSVILPENQVMICSGDEVHSEIGVGDLKNCTYKKVSDLSCWNFSENNPPIIGVAKKDFQKGVIVTFTDRSNPVRRVVLNTLSKLTNCDDARLFDLIEPPCIDVEVGQVGNLPNGSYSAVIAYSVNNQIFTDWFSITNRIQVHSLTGQNSLNLTINNLDAQFLYFSVGIVGTFIDPVTKGATKLAKIIGTFPTGATPTGTVTPGPVTILVSDFLNSTYADLPIGNLVVKKDTWKTAGIISSNSNYLIIGDLVGRPEENYQLKAMSIISEYVIQQVPAEYYSNGGSDVGYYGDENYDCYIEGVYNTGEFTDKFHIPGRPKTKDDSSLVSSNDVYEYDKNYQCETPEKIQKWQVTNTAGKMIPYNNKFVCGQRILGHGTTGYWESSNVYPENIAMFGKDAGTPIRYHKFPDESIISRYSIINGIEYINIKGIQFKNIPNFDSPDIIGYRITRSDRKGGNGTVVARGIMSNVRSFLDPVLGETVLYSNYTVNNLGTDPYLSTQQTVYKGNERNYTSPTVYYNDIFTFQSPHTLFEPKYSLGTEVKIECEEVATITGSFEKVYKHPQQKLLDQFSFWLAATVGFIESQLILVGKQTPIAKTRSGTSTGTAEPTYGDNSLTTEFRIESVEDLVGLDITGYITAEVAAIESISGLQAAGRLEKVIQTITTILTVLESLAIKIPFSIMSGIQEADKIINIIYDFTGYTDYVYQYNSHALFNNSIPSIIGEKRRLLTQAATYIPSDIVSIYLNTSTEVTDNQTYVYNNYLREETVLFQFNKPIKEPITVDNSLNTIGGFGSCGNPGNPITSTGSVFYATSKVVNPNQYGTLGSSTPVSMHSCVIPFNPGITLSGETPTSNSPVLYGGDCIITRFQFEKKMQFFNQNIANDNYPPGVEFDYRLYRNIAYPRYWMDSTKYDFSELIGSGLSFDKFGTTTQGKYNLDCKKGNSGNLTRIDNAYMYLSNNCIIDFFVEADFNTNFRDLTPETPFYSVINNNISQIFRSDRLGTPEKFLINRAYTDLYTTEIYAQQQRLDFDPNNPIPVDQPNAVIYSLPSFNLQEVDNWQYFLPANYFSFRESDFGILTGIHKLDQDRLIFLFSEASPYISLGKDFLQLDESGRKITIGDDGLFAQDPREIMPTDNKYAACNSRYAFSNTHLGKYYPSESQGRIMNFGPQGATMREGLDDITRAGMSYWCKNYMPIFLYEYFPDYPELENPISGVGYLTAFDSFNETIYITKRDFSPLPSKVLDIIWDSTINSFTYKGKKISVRDSNYFSDISWTLSYSPTDQSFISWHDWHPDWIIQTDNHFMSIKDNGVWKHNERYDSFCNFYGIDYPFEIEFVSSNGQQVETVRNLEYLLEVYVYKNNGRDRFHVWGENFDNLIVYNTEQISPLLNMTMGNPNPEQNLNYPFKDTLNPISYNIAFFKLENKYRVNQFWDSVADRGEFDSTQTHLFPTDESGYRNVINPVAININKPVEQRKKFRHYWNKFRLIRAVSGPNKFLSKLINIKQIISPR